MTWSHMLSQGMAQMDQLDLVLLSPTKSVSDVHLLQRLN